jgi:xanthine dehydrogenase accessory factor
MFDEFLNKAAELRERGESFAIALVVRFEAPISGKTGDKAIVYADGRMWGWIGGGCSQPVVIKEALKALRDGSPRLVRISPSTEPGSEEGIVDYTMTCHSGGTLDIYIEPVLAKPQILIVGRSVVAQTLAKLGKAINYSITVVAPEATREQFPGADAIHDGLNAGQTKITPQTYVVVSTQGENDEAGLEFALGTKAAYISFVASKPKIQKMFEYLREKGVGPGDLDLVHAPAGLQIGAVSPEEIAVSILAEIVQFSRANANHRVASKVETHSTAAAAAAAEAKDPVCGMTVETNRAKHWSQHQGRTIYFCCAHCRQAFDKEPGKYLVGLRT